MKEIVPIFPELVTVFEKYKFNENELKLLLDDSVTLKNEGGNCSSENKYILDHQELKNFKDFLEKQLEEHKKVLSIKDDVKIYITQSWVNFNKPNTEHHKHFHQNSIFRGIVYLGEEEYGFVHFEKQNSYNLIQFNHKDENVFNSNNFYFKLEKFEGLIFPSKLSHFVKKNENKTTRFSLSFNTFVKGDLGTIVNANYLKLT